VEIARNYPHNRIQHKYQKALCAVNNYQYQILSFTATRCYGNTQGFGMTMLKPYKVFLHNDCTQHVQSEKI